MNKKTRLITKVSITSGLALFVALAVWSSLAAQDPVKKHEAHQEHGHQESGHQESGMAHMNHITTQTEAEALKPGDSIAMACSKCKHIMVQQVTKDSSHVKLMTIGQTHKCDCGGTVTIVGTGKGKGKDQAVNHVCTKCGDNAMFVCAIKPGTGAMKDMEDKKN